ncbi:MAG: hypothetical protein D6727_09940 [Gammaproteobacteria bacterium]|nr:MAG: hypothetical protein D6727_09940 [Gammaproteobacteria bacterium]
MSNSKAQQLVRIALLAAAFAAAAGCSSGKLETKPAAEPLFFPPPPAPPRLQYLTRLSSQLDLGGQDSAFRSLVFGQETEESHLVLKPYGLSVHAGAVYVVDTRGGGYGVFDLAAGRTRFVRPAGPGRLRKPINISIDADGTRYLTDTERNQVLVFGSDDRFLRAFGQDDDYRPVDVLILGERLYVTDIAHHRIVVLDKASGEIVDTFGSVGSDPGELFQPTNLALGPEGQIYVTDTGNFRISVFTPEGEFVREIGQIGTVVGQFARPKGVAVDRERRVYVVDAAFENVQILAADGTPLLFFGGAGNGPGGLNLPTVVKIDYDNVDYFRQYADPSFEIEYLVLVASQFGANKVAVFGFGRQRDDARPRRRPERTGGGG